MLNLDRKFMHSILFGCSLAMILPSNYRMTQSVGLGELGLFVFIAVSITFWVGSKSPSPFLKRHIEVPLFFLYTVFLLLPLTLMHLYYETNGSSFRDLIAYLLISTMLISLAIGDIDIRRSIKALLIFILMIISIQYIWGGQESWYATRFTGGARNPNQLGLYAICSILLVLTLDINNTLKWLVSLCLLFFGLNTLSDAFNLCFAAAIIIFSATRTTNFKNIILLAPFISTPIILLSNIVFDIDISLLSNLWDDADEGGTRFTLYINGINAWLSTPMSFLIGNGAGYFSGLNGSFQLSESHNTIIDTLTQGGIIGLAVVYYLPLKCAYRAHKTKNHLIFACTVSLILFSLFHFVARHPIFWFTLFAISNHSIDKYQKLKSESNLRHTNHSINTLKIH